jgi:hypothetical protein
VSKISAIKNLLTFDPTLLWSQLASKLIVPIYAPFFVTDPIQSFQVMTIGKICAHAPE